MNMALGSRQLPIARHQERVVTAVTVSPMSSYRTAATATLIPPFPTFPTFIPEPPRPHHIPLAPRGLAPTRLNEVRDLPHELDDLSEEENELEDMVCPIEF